MPDISSPPERTEELVERVARAIYPALAEAMGGDAAGFDEDDADSRALCRAIARAALQSLGYAEMERENTRLREALKTARPLVASYGDHPDATDAMVRAGLRAAKQVDNALNGEMK